MRYSELAYNCIVASADLGDSSFTYENFISGEAEQNQDYAPSYGRVFADINGFLQRLSQLEKIPNVIESFDVSESNPYIDKSSFSKKPSRIQSVFVMTEKPGYRTLAWRTMRVMESGKAINKIMIVADIPSTDTFKAYVEYRPMVEPLGEKDIAFVTYDEDSGKYLCNGNSYDTFEEADEANNTLDVCEEYGITEEAMPLCMDWCKAKESDMDLETGHALLIETESRINDLDSNETHFHQAGVAKAL